MVTLLIKIIKSNKKSISCNNIHMGRINTNNNKTSINTKNNYKKYSTTSNL